MNAAPRGVDAPVRPIPFPRKALLAEGAADVAAWPGNYGALAEAGRKRLAQGRLEPLFLLFETALGEQMALRRRTMN